MKQLFPILLLAISLLGSGCKATLEPGGAYHSGSTNAVHTRVDMAFFVTDSAYDLAYSAIDAAFKFEKDNRALLWGRTKLIKRELDKLRPQAVEINRKYLAARAVYIASPTQAGLTDLQAILAEIQKLANAATAVLPSKTNP